METLSSLKSILLEKVRSLRGGTSKPPSTVGQFASQRADQVLGAPSQPQEVLRPEKVQPTPALPAGSYDVSQISKEQLNGLRASKDPKDHRLAATIERSQAAYAEMISQGSQVIANRSEGNGGYPVVTIKPPGFDPNKDARVHTHYHGYHSTVADPKGHGAGLTARLEEMHKRDAANGQQTVVVLPEASNAPDQGGRVKTNWGNVKSQARTTEDSLTAAGVTHPGYRVVSAHSGGGDAIANAINSDKSGAGLQADRLELQDSLYGSQGAVAQWGITPNGKAAKQVVYYHGTNTPGHDKQFPKTFGSRYHRVEVGTPRASDIPKVENPAGKLVPAYNANPHDRTKGQYLDQFPDA